MSKKEDKKKKALKLLSEHDREKQEQINNLLRKVEVLNTQLWEEQEELAAVQELLKKSDQEHQKILLDAEEHYKGIIESLRDEIQAGEDHITQIEGSTRLPPKFVGYFMGLDKEERYMPEPTPENPEPAEVVVKTAWVLMYGKRQSVNIAPSIDIDDLKIGQPVRVLESENRYTTIVEALDVGPVGKEDILEVKRIEGKYAIIEGQNGIKHLLISEYCEPLDPGDRVLVDREADMVICHAPSLEEEVDRSKIDPVGYEDVGGLDKQIEEIKEVVEMPFKEPERFKRLGVRAPRSILLKGEPGTGKTLLARVIANETDSIFLARSGAEFVSGGYRGTDIIKLQLLFDEAEKKRKKQGKKCAIIFIDEIDVLLPIRDDLHRGQHDIEVLVNAWLALMEGLTGRGDVVFIGATNKPDKMDPAARHRFDKPIDVPVPTDKGRLKILEIHTRNMPLVKGFDLNKIAEKTPGFVGRDLEHLCIEAALWADRRSRETEEDPEVMEADFLKKLETMRAEGLGSSVITNTGVSFEDVAGLVNAKQSLKEEIEALLGGNELYTYAGLKPRKGLLLVSWPGFGKTLLAKAVATECGMNFLSIKGTDVHIMWYGMSARALTQPFRRARTHSPCIIFLDELEVLAPWRGGGAGSPRADEKVVTALNVEMDGIEDMENVIVIAATNRPDLVDPATLSRFCPDGKAITLEALDENARADCFRIHTETFKHTLADDVDFKELAELTGKRKIVIYFQDRSFSEELPFNGREIMGLCGTAQRLALRDFKKGGGGSYNKEEFKVRQDHFKEAVTGKLEKEQQGRKEEEPEFPSDEDLDDVSQELNLGSRGDHDIKDFTLDDESPESKKNEKPSPEGGENSE